jgi:hypothetical protein
MTEEEQKLIDGLRWQAENAGGATLDTDEIEMILGLIDRLQTLTA